MPADNPLTPKERQSVEYHLGYPITGSLAPSIQLGIVKPMQTLFLTEQAMDLLNDDACNRVRGLLCTLETVEKQMVKAIPNLGIAAINGIRFREAKVGMRHTDLLEAEYRRWAERLADCLGCPLYPYSRKVAGGRGPGSIVRVRS